MRKTFEAVYEKGMLRPLKPLDLQDLEHVQVTITSSNDGADGISSYFEPAEWESSQHDGVSLCVVRRALSSIRGSLSDAVITSREERF